MQQSTNKESRNPPDELTDKDIWEGYTGPHHCIFPQDQKEYRRYMDILWEKIQHKTKPGSENTVWYCETCHAFIMVKGQEKKVLGHPDNQMVSTTKLFKGNCIQDVDSFMKWNMKKTMFEFESEEGIVFLVKGPVVNKYHDSIEYDTRKTKEEKRNHVITLNVKIKELERENQRLQRENEALKRIQKENDMLKRKLCQVNKVIEHKQKTLKKPVFK